MEIQFKIFIEGIGDDYNSKYIYIPIPPENFSINRNGKVEVVDILGLGEALIVKDKPLQSISFSSYLPINSQDVQVITYLDDYIANPDRTVTAINDFIKTRQPARLIVSKIKDDGTCESYINMLVQITDFTTSDVGGRLGDVEYSISFKEAQYPTTTQQVVKQVYEAQPQTTQQTTTTKQEVTVQVVEEPKQENTNPYVEGGRVRASGFYRSNQFFDPSTERQGKSSEFRYTNVKGTIKQLDLSIWNALVGAGSKFVYKVEFDDPQQRTLTGMLDIPLTFLFNNKNYIKETINGKTTYYERVKFGWFAEYELTPIRR